MPTTKAARPRCLAFVVFLAACTATPAPHPKVAEVRAAVAELGPGVRAAVWLSRPRQPPTVAIRPDAPMPCASSIKAAYLVELFDDFAGALDEPLPGCAAILASDAHPAIAHLGAARAETALRALGSASVRRIGEAMITGRGVDNATYNIAANVVTAHFGGPAGMSARLHSRDPRLRGLAVRRYMLAARDVTGDNEVTARSLAAVHSMLADGSVPGADPRAVRAARAILAGPDDDDGRRVFGKGGSLNSEPVARIRAGWREGPDGALVHVVLLAHDGAVDRDTAGSRLAAAARRIEEILLR